MSNKNRKRNFVVVLSRFKSREGGCYSGHYIQSLLPALVLFPQNTRARSLAYISSSHLTVWSQPEYRTSKRCVQEGTLREAPFERQQHGILCSVNFYSFSCFSPLLILMFAFILRFVTVTVTVITLWPPTLLFEHVLWFYQVFYHRFAQFLAIIFLEGRLQTCQY